MGLSVGNSRLGHGGLGSLNALNDALATNSVQTLIDAWMAAGIGSIALPDPLYYSTPIDAPGVLTDAVTGYPVVYSAASAAGTPLLVDDGSGPNGRAYFSANGISQTLIGSDEETINTYIGIFRSKVTPWNSYGSIIDRSTNNADPRLAFVSMGDTNFADSSPRSVSRNGLSLSFPFDVTPINEWQILTIQVPLASVVPLLLQLFALANTYFLSAELAALGKWLGPTDPTSEQIAAAEAAASTYSGIALV